MNKKKVLALTIALSMLVPTAAFAKEGGNKNNGANVSSVEKQITNIQNKDKQEADKKAKEAEREADKKAKEEEREADKKAKEEEKQAKEQKREEKKQQIEAFKTQMRAKHDQLTSLRKETEGLRKEVGQKKDQLSAILKDVQAGKKTLSQEMLNSLMDIAKNLKADGEQVKATSKINNEVADVQGKIKGEDFNNALASMDKVIAKMQARLDALKKLNSDLDEALKIANLAVAPDTTKPAEGTTETPTTGSTDNSSSTSTTDSTNTGSQTQTTSGTETTVPVTTENTNQAPATNSTETTATN